MLPPEPPRYPGSAEERWERRDPESLGLSRARLREAVEYAESHEVPWPRDIGPAIASVEKPPYNELLGPTRPRGPASGLVVRSGSIVAGWGTPRRVDVTFSATKSYLSILAGIAWDRGLIRDFDEPVRESIEDPSFDSPHNAPITWQHLLQQTSEWEGTLFGIPDLVDRNRSVQGDGAGPEKGTHRDLRAPGTWWEYNDIRVNLLGVCLLRLWGEPLPDVLRREVMTPIGASNDWSWHGYRNSWVDVRGRRLKSVPGGAHWGGGLWISSFDHARVGYLLLRRGVWDGKRVLSEAWLELATRPCDVNPVYGHMLWLNTERRLYPGASPASFAAQGAGGNVVLVEPERDLVIVTRWASDPAGIVERVIAAVD